MMIKLIFMSTFLLLNFVIKKVLLYFLPKMWLNLVI